MRLLDLSKLASRVNFNTSQGRGGRDLEKLESVQACQDKREGSILPSVEHSRHLAAAHVICNIMEPPLRVYVNSHFPVNNMLRIRTREEIL